MTEHDPEGTRPEHRPHHAMHRKRPARRATAGPTSLGEPLLINPAQDAADAPERPADPPSSAWRTLARQAARLEQEADRLTTTRDELKNSTGDAAALQAAKERLEMLGVLNGTLPATGPGIIITIQDNEKGVQAANLLDTVEELRDAGAEAIQINDQRVIVSTWFGGSSDTGLTVSGHTIRAPYTILAIGDPHTMSTAMAIPGGVVESLRSMGAAATVTSSQQVKVTALQPAQTPQYAQPEPSATAKESS